MTGWRPLRPLSEMVRLLAAAHAGMWVALEWKGKLDWQRFLWCRRSAAGTPSAHRAAIAIP